MDRSDETDPRDGDASRRSTRRRSFLWEEVLRLELFPKRRWDLGLEHAHRILQLLDRPAADHHRLHRWMAKRELDGSGAQRNAMAPAHVAHLPGAIDEPCGRVAIVVVSAGLWVCEDAAVVDARGDDRHASFDAGRQQLLQRHL